jgi:hypothetical protein
VHARSPQVDAAAAGGSAEARSPCDGPWPGEALPLAESLQRRLSIGDRDWHALKTQRPRRAAEQLAAALVQLLVADDPRQRAATPARRRAIELTEHALAWLRAEVSDPGCPQHGR